MMTFSSSRFLFRVCQWALALMVTQTLWAQGLRVPAQGGALRPLSLPLPLPAPASQRLSSDFIVAVVGSEPITNLEVSVRAQEIEAQLRQQGQRPPPREELLSEVLTEVESILTDIASVLGESLLQRLIALLAAPDHRIGQEEALLGGAALDHRRGLALRRYRARRHFV